VMIAGCRRLAGINRWRIVASVLGVVAAVFVTVVTKVSGMVLRMFQRIAHTDRRRVSSVERDQYGQQKSQKGAHGRTITDVLKLTEH
jgi:hypothetical protein